MNPPPSLFATIDCPLCGGSAWVVVKPAHHAPDVTEHELRNAYSASSSHMLLDQVVRCSACTLHFVNPRPTSSIILDGYSAAEDEQFVAQNPTRIKSFDRVLRKVLRRLGRRDGAGLRFLDVGCAGGASLVAARSLGFEAVGVEPSRWMADYGRRTYGVDIHQGILIPGMFPAESFDWISIWDVLEHVPEPGPLLDTIHGLLRPGGHLLLSYPDFRSVVGRALGNRWPFWLSVHLLYYDRVTIARQLRQSGLRVDAYWPYWMALEADYLAQRAAPYVPGMQIVRRMLRGLGLSRIPVTYTMGQTIVLAKKADA